MQLKSFKKLLKKLLEEYYDDPMGIPSLSPWITVRSVLPDFSEKFIDYVQKDNR